MGVAGVACGHHREVVRPAMVPGCLPREDSMAPRLTRRPVTVLAALLAVPALAVPAFAAPAAVSVATVSEEPAAVAAPAGPAYTNPVSAGFADAFADPSLIRG